MVIKLESIISFLESKSLDFSVKGKSISVSKLAAIGPGVKGAICYYVGNDPAALTGIENSIVFCMSGLKLDPKKKNTFIFTEHPQLCFYHISSLFEEKPVLGIHRQSVVDKSAIIGQDVSIGPFCFIDECTIGNNVIIESGVRIHKFTVIGNNVRIQANSVIGAIGVMWSWDSAGRMIPCTQTGNVIIEDNVFVNSNVAIVRGAFANKPTIIGRGTMVGVGTSIGHDSVIGAYNHFANNVSITGSVVSGKNCFFGAGATVRPHVKLPNDTIVGAGAVVVKDLLEEGITLIGNPARQIPRKRDKASGVPAPYSL